MPALLAVHGLLAGAALLPGLAGTQEPDSLEDLLARARAGEAAALEAARPEIEQRFEELRAAVVEGRRRPIEAARSRLVELGPIIAPLLVEHVDPGDPSDPDTRAVAVRVSQVLAQVRPSSITDELLDIARTGTLAGRLNAVRVLAVLPEPERVRPVLIQLFQRTDGPLHSAALAALARIGGAEVRPLLTEALGEENEEVVAIALRALADAKAAGAADQVLALARARERSRAQVPLLLEYYEACPETLSGPHVAALLDLATDAQVGSQDRVAVLDALGRHPEVVGSAERERLRSITRAPALDLREAALVCLVILGDRSARRELIEPYDERVEKNRTWARSYENRARVLYRIGEYRDAIRDYRKALDLGSADPRVEQEEAYVGLARCYALAGKLREAAQTLRDAPLTRAEVRALADDPDFAELRASSRYGDVFDEGR